MSVTCLTDITVIHIENSSYVVPLQLFFRGAVEPAAQQPFRHEKWRYFVVDEDLVVIFCLFFDATVYLNLNCLYRLNCFSAFALLLAFTFCFRLLFLANDLFFSPVCSRLLFFVFCSSVFALTCFQFCLDSVIPFFAFCL